MIEYDENVVILANYEYIDVFGGIVCPYQVNNPGYFALSCAGWGGLPFSGDGTLIELTFEKVDLGTAPLTFTMTSFGNKDIEPVPVVSDNGVLNVVDLTNLIYLPLLANMTVQGAQDRSGVSLSLAPGATFGYSYYNFLSTNIPGDNLSIPGVIVDTYTVTASHPGCLSASGTIVIPSDAASYSLPALVLHSGNAQDEDDIIDVYDLAIVNGAYNDFAANPEGDLNSDGLIDVRDLGLVAGNYGLTSAAAYADWLP